MFILFDPVYWINKTLATFDRLIAKLQKQVTKCEKEAKRNEEAIVGVNQQAYTKKCHAENKALRTAAKAKTKASKKMTKITDKSLTHTRMIADRNVQLETARKRAMNTAKNLNKLMGE